MKCESKANISWQRRSWSYAYEPLIEVCVFLGRPAFIELSSGFHARRIDLDRRFFANPNPSLGKGPATKSDEFSEKFQTACKPEPARYTWRSTCRTFVYMTSFTWQAFTWRNYCMTHDCMTSMCMKYIWMTKVSKTWRNKTMTHINRTTNNIYMTTQIHECHPRDTKEQLYDVRLHDVELHDVANTCFANVCHVNEVI